MVRSRIPVVLSAVLLILGASSTAVRSQTVVLTSKSPYWTVGVRDDKMSRACSLGRFNVARADRLVARFVGKEGAETLTVATGRGGNLADPGRLAKPAEDYYFRNAGTTSCEVFVGGRKKGPISSAAH
jgi:hypothetical protein